MVIPPETPAQLRDHLRDLMQRHEANGASVQKTNLGSLIINMIDLACIATPDDPNGPYREQFYSLNPHEPVATAIRCRASFTEGN